MKKWKIGLFSSVAVLTLSLWLYSDDTSNQTSLSKEEGKNNIEQVEQKKSGLQIKPAFNASIEKSVHLENDLQHQKIYFEVNHPDIKQKQFYIDDKEVTLSTSQFYDYTALEKGRHTFRIVLTNKEEEQQEVVLHFESYNQEVYDNIQQGNNEGTTQGDESEEGVEKEPISDTTAPIITFIQDGDKGVHIQIKDESKTTEHYTLNGSPISVENNYVPFAALQSNTYTLHVVSTDENKNHSEKSFDFIVDRESPLLNLVYEDVWSKEIDVRIEAIDVLSGIKEMKYAKGTQTSVYFETKGTLVNNESLILTENGDYTFYVVDGAGNTTTKTIALTKIDRVKPNITLEENDTYQETHTVAVQTSDDYSGIRLVEYVWSKETIVPTNGWAALQADAVTKSDEDGIWYLHIRATDRAGNQSYTKTKRYFDNIKPSFNTYLHTYNQSEKSYEFSLTLRDNLVVKEYAIIKGRVGEEEVKDITKTKNDLRIGAIDLTKVGTIKKGEVYTIYVKDAAGNETVGYIDAQATNFVYATHGGNKNSVTILAYIGTNVAKLVIPNELDGAPVKEIADYAFYPISANYYQNENARSETKLTGELVLPSELVIVGKGSFYGNQITIKNFYFEHLREIGADAFWGNTVQNFKLNDELVSIGDSAFYNSQTTGEFVVNKNSKLTNVSENSFYKNKLSNIVFDSSKTMEIGERTFAYNSYPGATLSFINDFTVIGKESFLYSDYSSILFNSKKIGEIREGAFRTAIDNYASELIINSSIDVIGEDSFENNIFSKIELNGDYIHEIKPGAFASATYYYGESSLIVNSNIDTIGQSAFINNSFINVEFNGEYIREIVKYAFQSSTGNDLPSSLTINSSIDVIGESAFQNNTFANITLNGPINQIEITAFQSATGYDTPSTLVINSNIKVIRERAFQSNNFETIELNAPVIDRIYNRAFQSAANNGSIYINSTINRMDEAAFENSVIVYLEINGKMNFIGDSAFANNRHQDATLVLNSRIEEIGKEVFKNSNFTEVHFNFDTIGKVNESSFEFKKGNDFIDFYVKNEDLNINELKLKLHNAAFHLSGDATKEVYQYALNNQFRIEQL